MTRPRADIVVCRCTRTDRHYGMRAEERPSGWVLTWAFPMSPSSAARQVQQDGVIEGNIECAENFPGCPHCGNQAFMQCGGCAGITCITDVSPGTAIRCAWCGNQGELGEGSITSLQGHGDL